MDRDLKKKLDDFIETFRNVPEVRQYLLLRKEIETSPEIKTLSETLRQAQKAMALSFGKTDYEDKKQAYFTAKTAYESHPLITNYEVAQKEVNYLLQEFQDKMK